jgi:hypothetical protein
MGMRSPFTPPGARTTALASHEGEGGVMGLFINCHSGMRRKAQTRNLEIPGSRGACPGMTAVKVISP